MRADPVKVDATTTMRESQNTPSFAYPVALCDIGGTNVRFAEIAQPGAPAAVVAHAATGEHNGLADAFRASAGSFSTPPRSLIVCAAGPVAGRSVKLTNARWTVDGPDVAADLDLEQGLLLNDFEAQAIMLPSLRAEHTRTIGDVAPLPGDNVQLVLGPGTGLGAGLLVPWQGRLMPLMTEAGHMDFGAASPFELDLWTVLRRQITRVTGESLLSGPGTVRLYQAVCELEGLSPATGDAAAITALAHETPDGVEARTLRIFWSLVGRYAGALALGLLAKGGVVLSGGILKKITQFLDPGEFRRAFDSQAPLQALVAKIPVTLVLDDSSVHDGLAALAADPGRFMIDYRARLWR